MKADRLSTGELQPRLPADIGAVRDQEHDFTPAVLPTSDPDAFELQPPPSAPAFQPRRTLFDPDPVF